VGWTIETGELSAEISPTDIRDALAANARVALLEAIEQQLREFSASQGLPWPPPPFRGVVGDEQPDCVIAGIPVYEFDSLLSERAYEAIKQRMLLAWALRAVELQHTAAVAERLIAEAVSDRKRSLAEMASEWIEAYGDPALSEVRARIAEAVAGLTTFGS
jgi:hypothetical protein